MTSKYEVIKSAGFRVQMHLDILIVLAFSQSLDYEICDNELYQNDDKFRETHSGSRKDFARWVLFVFIGKCHHWYPQNTRNSNHLNLVLRYPHWFGCLHC